MELTIKDIQSQWQKVLFINLAKILGLKTIEPGEVGIKKKRQAGALKGMLVYMADDFDAPLKDFKDYM